MPNAPLIDINLFVHDGARTVAAAIDSVLAQTWPNWRLTLIDDGSTDTTQAILRDYARAEPRIALKRNRCNLGAVGAFQLGFALGDADFVMPKSADDLIAPDFIERLMHIMLANPDCAMVHAGGLSFEGAGHVQFVYPPDHHLHAVGGDAVARAGSVMRSYTSSPSFWGVYRRGAVDRLSPILPRAGWDHALLAELALYGEIRHVPEALYWRRGGGKPIGRLARAATAESARGIGLDDPIADALWRTPCITTAFAHMEVFALARVSRAQRHRLIDDARRIFSWRWGAQMRREVDGVRRAIAQALPGADCDRARHPMIHLQWTRLLGAIAMVLPATDLHAERQWLARQSGEVPCLA